MSNQEPFCEGIIETIGNYYRWNIYVYISIPICLVGMILNLLNVLVFTRKTMNSLPNLILAHLAFVDFLYLLSYIANFWVIYIQFESDLDRSKSYGWTVLYWYSDLFATMFQFISIFLTMQLAAWRYIAVVHPLKERNWCTKKITRNVIMTGYVICCVSYAIPYHLSFHIEAFQNDTDGKAYYTATIKGHLIMNSIRYIVYGLVIKILPPFVLAGLTLRIVVALLLRKSHREHLSTSASTRSDRKNVEMRQQTKRSTTILLAVVALFFIGDFPRGMLWLLRAINERDWEYCYDSVVQILNTITNINTSITFMVYYTLSQQFRTTFKSLFLSNKRTSSHQTHTPLALDDRGETESGRKTSQV